MVVWSQQNKNIKEQHMLNPKQKSIIISLTLIVLIACGGKGSGGSKETGKLGDGVISGVVSYVGAAPEIKTIPLSGECSLQHKSVKQDSLLVSDGNIANVIIKISSGLGDVAYPAPVAAVTYDQAGCVYAPHVAVAMVSQEVRFLNNEAILHNVHAISQVNPGFNKIMVGAVKELTQRYMYEEEPFLIKCDIHPWMGAYLAVLSHPFFAVTGADGKYEIKNIPAGDYELSAWHEKLGTEKQKVSVHASGKLSIDWSFTAK
jgi:plastocyanin